MFDKALALVLGRNGIHVNEGNHYLLTSAFMARSVKSGEK